MRLVARLGLWLRRRDSMQARAGAGRHDRATLHAELGEGHQLQRLDLLALFGGGGRCYGRGVRESDARLLASARKHVRLIRLAVGASVVVLARKVHLRLE